MAARGRQEAAEILRRVIELLPKLSPAQRDYLQGVAAGLDLKTPRRSRPQGTSPRERSKRASG